MLVGCIQKSEGTIVARETGNMGHPEYWGKAPQANATVEHVGRQISAHLLLISLVLINESKLNLN